MAKQRIINVLFTCFMVSVGGLFVYGMVFAEKKTVPNCSTPYYIKSVDKQALFNAYHFIKQCVPPEGKLDVYIEGLGGTVNTSQAFFDHMWSSGLAYRVRFISQGLVASASNLVWLSSAERIVTPGSSFLVHELKTNHDKEDEETREEIKKLVIASSTRAVAHVASAEAAELWYDCAHDERVGAIFDGAEALRLGWATELRNYQ